MATTQGFDRSMTTDNIIHRSPSYLSFIRQQPCCLTGAETEIESYHQDKDIIVTESRTTCDSRAIPVHWKQLRKMKSQGHSRESVFASFKVDPEVVIRKMQALWLVNNKHFWE